MIQPKTNAASTIGLSSIVTRTEGPVFADVGEDIVVMSVEQGKYYDLDPISSDVWRVLAQPVRVADLCATLYERYDGERSVITADVLALLERLVEQQLVSVQPM